MTEKIFQDYMILYLGDAYTETLLFDNNCLLVIYWYLKNNIPLDIINEIIKFLTPGDEGKNYKFQMHLEFSKLIWNRKSNKSENDIFSKQRIHIKNSVIHWPEGRGKTLLDCEICTNCGNYYGSYYYTNNEYCNRLSCICTENYYKEKEATFKLFFEDMERQRGYSDDGYSDDDHNDIHRDKIYKKDYDTMYQYDPDPKPYPTLGYFSLSDNESESESDYYDSDSDYWRQK